jgi:hypothetical protein
LAGYAAQDALNLFQSPLGLLTPTFRNVKGVFQFLNVTAQIIF